MRARECTHALFFSTLQILFGLLWGQEVATWGLLTFWKKATVRSGEATSCPKLLL